MLDQLNEIEKTALESLESVHDQAALEAWRVANVGRSSPLMQVFAGLGKLSREERPAVGAAANRVKVALESALAERAEAIKNAALAKSLEEEQLDVTLPGRTVHMGRLHPSTQQLRRVLDILAEMGFQVYTSREVETDEVNFQTAQLPAQSSCARYAGYLLRGGRRARRQPDRAAHAHLAGSDPCHARVRRHEPG